MFYTIVVNQRLKTELEVTKVEIVKLLFFFTVSSEQQLQSFFGHLLPAAGKSKRAPQSAAEPSVWDLEPETQEHLGLLLSRGEGPAHVYILIDCFVIFKTDV